MIDYKITLGDAGKNARTKLDLTQSEVADLIDADSRTILNIENYKGKQHRNWIWYRTQSCCCRGVSF